MDTVFLTGGTGLVGGAVARALAQRGQRALALARPTADVGALVAAGAELVPGDLLEPSSWRQRLRGCEVVIHCAAATGVGRGWSESRRLNVDGTRIVLDAAIAAGVRRLVNLSSVSVYGLAAGVYDEGASLPRTGDPYSDTKQEAEAMCQAAHADDRMETVTVRPTLILGPGGEGNFFPTCLQMLSKKSLPLIGGGRAAAWFVDADDVAEQVLQCAERPAAAGRVYNSNSLEPIDWRAFVQRLVAYHGLPLPRALPSLPLYAVGGVLEVLAALHLLPGPPPLRRFDVDFFAADRSYPMARAERDLGFRPRYNIEAMLARVLPLYTADGKVAGGAGPARRSAAAR